MLKIGTRGIQSSIPSLMMWAFSALLFSQGYKRKAAINRNAQIILVKFSLIIGTHYFIFK
jgi:hypothetical protein